MNGRLAVVLAGAVGACVLTPGLARAEATVINGSGEFPITNEPFPNPCNGDTVYVTAVSQFRFNATFDAADGSHVDATGRFAETSATSSSGVAYQVHSGGHFVASGDSAGISAVTVHGSATLRLVSAGPGDDFHIQFHDAFTVTPEGDATVDRTIADVRCDG